MSHVHTRIRVSHSAYVDEHVEARYEEIINHLHKALSSTEQDEQDFKVSNLSLKTLKNQTTHNTLCFGIETHHVYGVW